MTLLERLRAALSADYEVREEIGRGGMGAVFLAVDRTLVRSVAIKVLLPELATARGVERFLREARALAAVEHPRVLQVHHAGEAEGLYYSVMELARGKTLAERLERGPLDRAGAGRLAEDLLDALAAIHEAGIVHRDVKPSNIFLVEGRAVLGDFGVALPSPGPDRERLTSSGEMVGTVGYLAPEQRSGEVTQATDQYAAALVLYEACTGAPWQDRAGSESPWEQVPRAMREPLQRALRPDPADRWPDVAAFRAALETRAPLRTPLLLAGILVVLAALVPILLLLPEGGAEASVVVGDLAVLPFEVVGSPAAEPAEGGQPCSPQAHIGCQLAHLTAFNLGGLPELKVIPAARVSRLGPAGAGELDPQVRRSLRTRYVARGPIVQHGERLELRLIVEDSLGRRLPERTVAGLTRDPLGFADSVALALVRLVQPRLLPSFRGLEERSTSSLEAMRAFLLGEGAFHANAWSSAEEHYRQALAIDSTFALAEWRLWNVFRWRLSGREVVDLEALYRNHADDLPTVERALLAAVASGPGTRRIEELEKTARQHGYDGYTRLLFGDELYHRGPLIGRPLGESVRQLREAAARNPYMAPAYEHGLLALIRLGRETDARDLLAGLRETASPAAAGEVHYSTMLEQAFLERFAPDSATVTRERLFDVGTTGSWEPVLFAARMGLAVDIPAAQAEVGRWLVDAAPNASLRSNGHLAQGLALMVLGRPGAALPHFDSAAALADTPEAASRATLEAAEWRVVFPALDLVQLSPAERERGRERLRAQVLEAAELSVRTRPETRSDDAQELASRAAWALALDASAAGNPTEAGRWRRAIVRDTADPEQLRLHRLAEAFGATQRVEHQHALDLSEPLLADQFLPRSRDPFTRTVAHLLRARAFEALGDSSRARRERVWSENQDIVHVLDGPIQAVEVDWAASPYSDRQRARLALAAADTAEACHLLERVLRLWETVEPAIEPDRAEVRGLHAEICP